MAEYQVTVIVTYEGVVQAESERDAIEVAERLNGAWPLDQVAVEVTAEAATSEGDGRG